jgi:hypothetical protein
VLAAIVFLALAFFEIYNWDFLYGKSIHYYLEVSTIDVLSAIVALVLAWYAFKTIDEMKRDRRKDAIEKQLEAAYSPLYEILRRAGFESTDHRNSLRGDAKWAVSEAEYSEMRMIIEKHGHHLGRDEAARISKLLQEAKRQRPVADWSYALPEPYVIERYEHLKKLRDDLIDEYDELTNP